MNDITERLLDSFRPSTLVLREEAAVEIKRLRAISAELLAALEAAQEWFAANGRDHRAVNAAIAKTKGKLR